MESICNHFFCISEISQNLKRRAVDKPVCTLLDASNGINFQILFLCIFCDPICLFVRNTPSVCIQNQIFLGCFDLWNPVAAIHIVIRQNRVQIIYRFFPSKLFHDATRVCISHRNCIKRFQKISNFTSFLILFQLFQCCVSKRCCISNQSVCTIIFAKQFC